METQLENLNKQAATNGLIIGAITSVLGIITYYVVPQMMGSMSYGIGMMLVSLVIYIIFTIDLRKKIGGFWSFKEALRGIFLMALVAGVLGLVVNYLFYNFIEPGAYDKIVSYVTDNLNNTYAKLGMSQDQIDLAVEKALESMKAQFKPTLFDLLKSFGISIIIEFIMSLIFAAIFKKEKPVFAPIEE